mgnify:CR=1 FL=1
MSALKPLLISWLDIEQTSKCHAVGQHKNGTLRVVTKNLLKYVPTLTRTYLTGEYLKKNKRICHTPVITNQEHCSTNSWHSNITARGDNHFNVLSFKSQLESCNRNLITKYPISTQLNVSSYCSVLQTQPVHLTKQTINIDNIIMSATCDIKCLPKL